MRDTGRLGLAVVGLGAFGQRYIRAFGMESDVDVLWGCDPDVGTHRLAEQHGAHSCTIDISDVLADDRVGGVVIVTPEALHRDLSVRSSTAGKHVIVEKPLATDDTDATAMIAAARAAGTLLLPAFLLRFDSRYGALANRLDQIGPIRNVYAYRNFDRSLFETYGRSHSFVENAIHDIDLIRWYLRDDVIAVHGFCRNTSNQPNPNINWGLLEFRGGALAAIQTSWLYPPQRHDDLQWNAGIQVMGDAGVLEVRFDADGFRANSDATGLVVADQSAWSELHGRSRGAFGAMIRHFVDCMLGHAEPAGASAEDARIATRIAQQLIASSNSNTAEFRSAVTEPSVADTRHASGQ